MCLFSLTHSELKLLAEGLLEKVLMTALRLEGFIFNTLPLLRILADTTRTGALCISCDTGLEMRGTLLLKKSLPTLGGLLC